MGYVYLMLAVDSAGIESYKIGITRRHPEKRLKQLQTGNSRKIDLIAYYESEHYAKIERNLHLKYFSYRTESENEWRELPLQEVIQFKDLCQKHHDMFEIVKADNPFL